MMVELVKVWLVVKSKPTTLYRVQGKVNSALLTLGFPKHTEEKDTIKNETTLLATTEERKEWNQSEEC